MKDMTLIRKGASHIKSRVLCMYVMLSSSHWPEQSCFVNHEKKKNLLNQILQKNLKRADTYVFWGEKMSNT